MFLYSREEVCTGCKHANWHHCDKCVDGPHFCHCDLNIYPDFSSGKCSNYTVLTNTMHSDSESQGVKTMGDILRESINIDKQL